ncbi:MAG: hypothetical protein GX548_07050 [Lentisphaerae bacterium]|nr:hypothetical protein [Lentisphaerota bacterium]
MRRGTLARAALLLLACGTGAALAENTTYWRVRSMSPNVILSADSGGRLGWTNTVPGQTDRVERATSLIAPDWRDFVLYAPDGPAVSVKVFDLNPPPGMVLIPGGLFEMGDHL